jgi:cell wall-associated NlpC family hydrolase
MTTRADIVAKVREYIGTPWHHAARLPGVGLDCAGIIVCAMRELGLAALDFDIPAYTRTPDGRTMREWCERYMTPIPQSAMQPGDAILLITDLHPQHLAVLGDYLHGGLSIIHAANNASPPRVIETRLMFSRALRFVAAYSLPGVV